MVTRYVVSPRGGWRSHPDIASALRVAEARRRPAVIEIAPGHYQEALTVRGEVELVAADGPGTVTVGLPRGTVLDAHGSVRVSGLVLTGRDADVVSCHTGTLTLAQTEIRAPGGVAVHARPHTSVTVRDSRVLHGRALFRGAAGLVERCSFTDAADNAVAVIEGAHVLVRDSRIDGSRIHGVRVSDARAELSGCTLTGTEKAAIVADARAGVTVTDCLVTGVHAEGILFIEQSRGTVAGTRVVDAEHGIAVTSGADPVVRGCVFADCRDTGINVTTAGRGRFEKCEVLDARVVSVFSTTGGAPEVHGLRIAGGNVGIAVTDGARGRFTGIRIADLATTALRVWDGSGAVFEDVTADRCPAGLDTRGDGGTTAEVVDAAFRDFGPTAVVAGGQSRITLRRVAAERGPVGFAAAEEGRLFLYDCTASAVSSSGAGVIGQARLVARNLIVTGSDGLGLCGRDSAYLDVAHSEFRDCAVAGAAFEGTCSGTFTDCSISGRGEKAVRHNGRVDLIDLRTSLPVVRQTDEVPEPAPMNVYNYHGPVFNQPVHGSQLAWNNQNVVQQQTPKDGSRP
ncbi:right-handed parallel beta-helix repeat-containing protein [Streptomyces sp. NPDC004788]